jgi:hypothetical protein
MSICLLSIRYYTINTVSQGLRQKMTTFQFTRTPSQGQGFWVNYLDLLASGEKFTPPLSTLDIIVRR